MGKTELREAEAQAFAITSIFNSDMEELWPTHVCRTVLIQSHWRVSSMNNLFKVVLQYLDSGQNFG